jgi:nucleotide-binding universal stress UspA family protein
MIAIRRIIVPIDFSEYSKKALRYAVEFARSFRAEIVLVYVVEPIVTPADFSVGQMAVPGMESDFAQRGAEQLDKLLDTVVADAVAARAVVRHGKPFVEIIRLAREEQADLIIIATHGHTGIEHALFGSTAEKVVRKAPCPVLSIRDPAQEFSLP